jgi:demethylmenaquinone methyltransferase / 2-methoxy-6-polyprenyl-1,4-benzoquinol methylase
MSYTKSSPQTIQTLFSKIATRYDLCNSALSFNLHKRWNKNLVRELLCTRADNILDLCAGTGDIAFEFSRHLPPETKINLLDFCGPMLEVAKKKAAGLKSTFEFIQGDATALPFTHDTFSQVSIACGIRNVHDPKKCMNEAFRVLKKGGVFGILELTCPKNSLIRTLHSFYLKFFVPLIGKLTTAHKEPYQYLDQSIKEFQTPEAMKSTLEAIGFKEVKIIPQSLGIASILIAKK